jgi:histidinol-phosphatase
VDGSQNFSRGIPFFATLLAIEQDGRVVAGLVSAPALFTRWSAGRGLGAFRGRSRMRVSAVSDLAQASLFYGDLAPASAAGKHWPILPLMQRVKRARGFGDFYQHVLVAEGAGEIAIDTEIRPWAVAPFMVILEEAGGMVSSLRGEDSFEAGSFVSSNGLLHDKALAILTASASQEKVRQTE